MSGTVIARAGVPGCRHNGLIVGDLAVLDDDPVTQRATRRLIKAYAMRFLRPAVRFPFFRIGNLGIAGLDIRYELIKEESLISAASWASRPRTAVRPTMVGIQTSGARFSTFDTASIWKSSIICSAQVG